MNFCRLKKNQITDAHHTWDDQKCRHNHLPTMSTEWAYKKYSWKGTKEKKRNDMMHNYYLSMKSNKLELNNKKLYFSFPNRCVCFQVMLYQTSMQYLKQ